MDGFKLKSIDKFDLDFINNVRVETKSEPVQSDLIPQMETTEIQNEETVFEETREENTYFSETETEEKPKTPRPLTPIGQKASPYVSTDSAEAYSPEIILSEDDFDVEETTVRTGSKGILAGKIISIIMLCVTVVVFLLGCFTATFLDTFEIGGTNISTLCSDVDVLKLSQGDLLISKVHAPNEYAVNSFVVVPEEFYNGTETQNLATIGKVTAITPYADSANIEVINLTTENVETFTAEECKGEILFYIPLLAGVLNFALQASNAILVCALFVLLAAFWCLLLVLLSKATKKNKEPEVDLINE